MSSRVKSAERTLDVLELLASHLRPVPTMAIAEGCGIPKSSCHHLLNVLRDRAWVTYYEDERAWGLGVAALETGWAYMRADPLERLARPLLVELAERVDATVHLAVPHGQDVLYLHKEEPPHAVVRLVTKPGLRLPAHLTAVGRAILAGMSDFQVKALYPHSVLVQRTNRGPRTLTTLLEELSVTRRKGYAFEVGLTTPGIACLAAVVMSHEEMPIAAIGATFVAAERVPDHVEAIAAEVVSAAQRLGRATGRRQPPGETPPQAGLRPAA